MVCHACSESKVLHSLQNVDGRGNLIKAKIALCYATLVDKLGSRIKTFRENGRLIRAICGMLEEGALEVRNQAKAGIITVHSNLENQREFDTLLIKSALSEKQMTQVKKVVSQGDSGFNQTTRYGSIRGSSLDSRGLNVEGQGRR